VHRHAAARFRLRTAYLVLHFSDEALAGYRQPVADQGALIDLRVDHRRQTKLAGLAAVEEHVNRLEADNPESVFARGNRKFGP
jgi:hypothetical protein